MYSIHGLPGTRFLTDQVGAICFPVRKWVLDANMPGTLVADDMGLGKTFTSVAAAMLC
jgi:SNF2 family DNA or RNA helicase